MKGVGKELPSLALCWQGYVLSRADCLGEVVQKYAGRRRRIELPGSGQSSVMLAPFCTGEEP